MRIHSFTAALLASCSMAVLAAPTSALAQASDISEVVVTGSRVITNGNNSPTPVTVVDAEQLQQVTPSNIPDALNRLPVFAGSSNQTTFNNGSGNATGNYLNLRRVGTARTLVLFDGNRLVPTTQDGLIDVNTIPQMLIKRVDVVTGGASAVYGSDAITGVVNFVVDKEFNGLKLLAQGGISSRNDNGSKRFGIAVGRPLFDGRGHFEASFEYYNSDGIDDKVGRAYGRAVYSTQGGGTVANPYHLIRDTRIASTSNYGVIRSGPLNDMVFGGPNNALRPFVHGSATGTTGIESGGDGSFYNSSLQASLRSKQGFARFDYDLTDSVEAYVQVTGTRSYNSYSKEESEVRNLTMSAQNAYLPAAARATMAAAGVNTFTFSRVFTELPRLTPTAWIDSYLAVAGLNGKLGENWNWDTAYTRARSKQRVATLNNVSIGRREAAMDAVVAPNGSIVCNVTLTNPGLYPGCVPINLFGERTITPEAQAYIMQDTNFRLKTGLDDLKGGVSGTPFNTWAGPVRMAVSGEYRQVTLDLVSEAQPLGRTNCTGLRFNCGPNTGLFTSNVVADARDREQHVAEAAVEVDVPLLVDAPFAKSLNLNAAARYTKYNNEAPGLAESEFTAKTWKVGLDWHVTDELSFRATRSRDIRAPNLNDLYGPTNVNPSGFFDLHTGLSLQVPVQTQGNPDLVPEVANTLTVGGVYRPMWLPRFSVAIDYYRIKIGNAIGSVSGNNSSVQAECETSGGTSPLCDLFLRPLPFSDRSPANFPTRVFSRPLNVSTLKTHGVDTEVNYAMTVPGGELTLRGLASYQPENVTVNFVGGIPIDQAGAAGLPTWRLTGFISYAHQSGFSIDAQERWHNSTKRSGDPTLVFSGSDVAARAYTDLTVSYDFEAGGAQSQVFLSVQNLWDRQPAPWVNTGGSSSVPGFFVPTANGDDPIGRYFTGGVRLRF